MIRQSEDIIHSRQQEGGLGAGPGLNLNLDPASQAPNQNILAELSTHHFKEDIADMSLGLSRIEHHVEDMTLDDTQIRATIASEKELPDLDPENGLDSQQNILSDSKHTEPTQEKEKPEEAKKSNRNNPRNSQPSENKLSSEEAQKEAKNEGASEDKDTD